MWKTSRTDWDCVRKSIETTNIPYDPNDPDVGPYDPNNDASVEAYLAPVKVWRGWPPNQVLIQKDGVPVHPDGTPRLPRVEEKAKAS